MKSHLKWNPLSQSLFIWRKVSLMMILTGWQTFWLIKCRKIMVMAGMHLYKEKGKTALDTMSNQVPFTNMNLTTLFLLSTKILV